MSDERNENRNRPSRDQVLAAASAAPPSAPDASLALDGPDGRHVRSTTRKPFGSMVQKLAVPPREGYHRYWFNEEPGRVDQAKENGYNFVLDANKKPMTRVVNRAGQIAFLMEIPKEWFDEDLAAQQQAVDDKEDTIRRGQVEASDPRDRDGRFRNTAQGRGINIRNTMARGRPTAT